MDAETLELLVSLAEERGLPPREGVRDVEVRGAGASYDVRARASSETVVERLLASLRAK